MRNSNVSQNNGEIINEEVIFIKERPDFDFPYENTEEQPTCLCFKRYVETHHMSDRKIVSNRIDESLPDNSIQTNKYTKLNFAPKNLLEQFSKKANIYFLFIGIMQTIPYISISGGVPAIFLPLVFILIITAMKDFFEDYKRKKSDNEENSKKVMVFENGVFVEKQWKDLRVGNIIELGQNDFVPADILLLWSSENKGTCYIETKNLDGETNLKTKMAKKEIAKLYNNENTDFNDPTKMFIFDYERPTQYLYNFQGFVMDYEGNKYKIDNTNFILRGCSIKNSKRILGLVSYTGHHTKIMLNSFRSRAKKSKIERIMGQQIILIFLIQILLCFFCAIYYLVWYTVTRDYLNYLRIDTYSIYDNNGAYNFFVRYGNWTLIFTNFVPISLLVTLETVKFIQGYFIYYDEEMKLKVEKKEIIEPSNSVIKDNKEVVQLIPNTTVQSSNLNEELGQIEYIFSDKTGTLTCNMMDFKKISIGGISYGDYENEMDPDYIKNYDGFPKVTNVDFRSRKLLNELENIGSFEQENIKECLFMLAICHTVISEFKNNELTYTASSPDEMALVSFAKFCGVEYEGTDEDNNIKINYRNSSYKYKLLEIIEFDSDRKRQSIIVKNPDGEIVLYCKGADSSLNSRLVLNDNSAQDIKEKTWEHLSDYGRIGLRTLVLAKKKIDNKVYLDWSKRYQNAQVSKENRQIVLSSLQDEIENQMFIVGATGIEDKLQPEVTETIQALKDAGIKVWVLTGDKIDTAINIGYSCGLLNNFMVKHIVTEEKENELDKKLKEIISQMDKDEKENKYNANALVIHGDSLLQMIKPFIKASLKQITEKCLAVLCCRVSPKQKQEIVQFVRSGHPNASTLAIGDGANDVNMITAAHVGVGIRGVEGQQAARASDYAIGEFRILRRLLFFHGRECYRRNSYLVLYNFFKNICLVMPQFWYGITNSFSGQTLYDSYIYQLFNIFYASLPIIIYSIFDKELNAKILVENKINYYEQGIKSELFNAKIFWTWVFFAAWQSVILAFFCYYSLELNFVNENGYMFFFWATGNMVYGMCVVIVNLKIVIFSNTHSFLSMMIIILSMVLYLITIVVSEKFVSSETFMIFTYMINTSNFHYANFLIICATCLIDFGFENYKKFKNRIYLIQKKEKDQKLLAEHQKRINDNNHEDTEKNEITTNRENKEAKTLTLIKTSIYFASMFNKKNKDEIPGIFIKNADKHNGFAFSQDIALQQQIN